MIAHARALSTKNRRPGPSGNARVQGDPGAPRCSGTGQIQPFWPHGSVTAAAAEILIGRKTRDAQNDETDEIDLKAARFASLHHRGGMALRKIALIFSDV